MSTASMLFEGTPPMYNRGVGGGHSQEGLCRKP